MGGRDPERVGAAGEEDAGTDAAGVGAPDLARGLFSACLSWIIVSILMTPRFVGIVEAGGIESAKTSHTGSECFVKALLGATAHPAQPPLTVARTSAIFAAVTPIGKPVTRYLNKPTILAVLELTRSSSGLSASRAAAALALANLYARVPLAV